MNMNKPSVWSICVKKMQKAVHVMRFRIGWRSVFIKIYLRLLGAEIGGNVKIAKGLMVTWPQNLSIGNNVTFERNVTIKIDGPWKVGRIVEIGDNVFIGEGVEFNVRQHVKVGCNALIASGVRIIDHDHGVSRAALIREQKGPEQSLKIGDDSWLGANACILKGARIGKGAVVAAGAVVTRAIPDYEIWAGVPAKKIGVRKIFSS